MFFFELKFSDKKKDENFGLNSRHALTSPTRRPPMDHSSSSSEPEGPNQTLKMLSSLKKNSTPVSAVLMKQTLIDMQLDGMTYFPSPPKPEEPNEKAAGDMSEQLLFSMSRPRSSTLIKNPLEDPCDIVSGISELELSPVSSSGMVSVFFVFCES